MFKLLKTNVYLMLQGEKAIPVERLARIEELIEPWFIFALVWSIGMTGDYDSQLKFSKWIKDKMKQEEVGICV